MSPWANNFALGKVTKAVRTTFPLPWLFMERVVLETLQVFGFQLWTESYVSTSFLSKGNIFWNLGLVGPVDNPNCVKVLKAQGAIPGRLCDIVFHGE